MATKHREKISLHACIEMILDVPMPCEESGLLAELLAHRGAAQIYASRKTPTY